MKKRYFKFTEASDPSIPPGILSGTHGVEKTAQAMRAADFLVEEITAKQAARIRQQQRRPENLARRVQKEMES